MLTPPELAPRTSGLFALPGGDGVEGVGRREWDALAATASDPNPFAERWFVEASARHLSPPASARLLVVRDGGTLLGLMPVATFTCYGRIPVRHLQNWRHVNSFHGAPLVRAGAEAAFWRWALDVLDEATAAPLLHIDALEADSALATALLAARSGTAVVHRSERALLRSTLSPDAYWTAAVRAKKRKEIARLAARLAEQGTLTTERWPDEGCTPGEWADDFLRLEASGWKGREGAALGNAPETAAWFHALVAGAAAAKRLTMTRLRLDGRTIAALIAFRTPPGAYQFKIAFDEAWARFSPGVLLERACLRVLDDPAIAWTDSCAAPDHPMINAMWTERRRLVRMTVPLGHGTRRLTFAACRALEEASALRRRLRPR